jgi:histidinol-phosphate aminotransferase
MKSDVIYICSPNNPTGNQFEESVIFELLNILKDKLTIIDEAYVEFADYSVSPHIAQYDNVVILRTLSKAFGLAGARIGYLVADERFAEIFRNIIQSPYPINSFSLQLASLALSCYDTYVKQTLDLIKRERKRVFDHLFEMDGIKVFKSNANFIFVELYDNYDRILRALKEDRVSVKAFGNINGYEGCIRVTIGTTEMNDKFLKSVSAAI